MSEETLTYERANELYAYESGTGFLIRKVDLGASFKAGGIAGYLHPNGYLWVSIDLRKYAIHRVVFLLLNKRFPKKELDHINHIRTDNRIENLREVTSVENHRNRKLNSNNTSGCVGVYAKGDKWQVSIGQNRKNINLGVFEKKGDAISARKAAEVRLGYHELHGT